MSSNALPKKTISMMPQQGFCRPGVLPFTKQEYQCTKDDVKACDIS